MEFRLPNKTTARGNNCHIRVDFTAVKRIQIKKFSPILQLAPRSVHAYSPRCRVHSESHRREINPSLSLVSLEKPLWFNGEVWRGRGARHCDEAGMNGLGVWVQGLMDTPPHLHTGWSFSWKAAASKAIRKSVFSWKILLGAPRPDLFFPHECSIQRIQGETCVFVFLCGHYMFSLVSSRSHTDPRPEFPVGMNVNVCLSICEPHIRHIRLVSLSSISAPSWPSEGINEWFTNGQYSNFTFFSFCFSGLWHIFWGRCGRFCAARMIKAQCNLCKM